MNKHFWSVTLILIFITVFSITGTVQSQDRDHFQMDKDFYRQEEKAYVREIRSFLAEAGFENSGVMLTYVAEAGERQYTVTIHHEKLTTLSLEEREQLRQEVLSLAFAMEEGGFSISFL